MTQKISSETAAVMIAATGRNVMLRRKLAHGLAKRVPRAVDHLYTLVGLVTHDHAAVELDHLFAHHVHDALVMGGHQHRVPVWLIRPSRRMMSLLVAGSRSPVGLSASRISGRVQQRRPWAIDTRCCSTSRQLGRQAVLLASEADEVEDGRHLLLDHVLRLADDLSKRTPRSRR